jgi:hypothetical protein
MTFFLAFLNYSFHAFIDYDTDGKLMWCVDAMAIVQGEDDYFGEDDHMTHHYATHVYWRDLDVHRQKKLADCRKYHATIFDKISIVEVSAFLLFKDFDRLAGHFVDYNDHELSPAELEAVRKANAEACAAQPESRKTQWMNMGKLPRPLVAQMLKERAQRVEE